MYNNLSDLSSNQQIKSSQIKYYFTLEALTIIRERLLESTHANIL